jgi:5-methylcytosine-specific restriction endonuclease McrA
MNKAENSKCLLLNADYSPLKLICWRKAIIWSLKYTFNHNYTIEIIEYYKNKYIQGVNNQKYSVPLVAKTLKYFNLYNRSLKFSRNNLFVRDNYTCQYCGQILDYNELTYDHVIPKSKFILDTKNATNWENVTTSCVVCNRKKSNKTPEQAKMKLLNVPKKPVYEPKYLPVVNELSNINYTNDPDRKEWIKYINGNF